MTLSLNARSMAPAVDVRLPQYQALKGRIHQALLNRLNLDRLARVKRAEAEPEIRSIVLTMLRLSGVSVRARARGRLGCRSTAFGLRLGTTAGAEEDGVTARVG